MVLKSTVLCSGVLQAESKVLATLGKALVLGGGALVHCYHHSKG